VTRKFLTAALFVIIASTSLFGRNDRAADTIPLWVFFRDRGFADQEEIDTALEARAGQLSDRVLRRRAKTLGNTPVLPGDLPLNPAYVAGVLKTGCKLRRESRWLNAVSVDASALTIPEIAIPVAERGQRGRLGLDDPRNRRPPVR
jgi:hypothetical protein